VWGTVCATKGGQFFLSRTTDHFWPNLLKFTCKEIVILSMEQRVFAFSLIIEGATEMYFEFKMPLE